ncbi:MAG: hypothetical protein ACLTZN_02920 [Streptococcus sp.]
MIWNWYQQVICYLISIQEKTLEILDGFRFEDKPIFAFDDLKSETPAITFPESIGKKWRKQSENEKARLDGVFLTRMVLIQQFQTIELNITLHQV